MKDNIVFKDVEFDFFPDRDGVGFPAPYFTLIIGPNGTGKSHVLRFVIDILHIAYEKKNEEPSSVFIKGKYYLEYHLGGEDYVITNRMGWMFAEEPPEGINDAEGVKGVRFFKNGREIYPNELVLPESITAISNMLTDKYPFFRDDKKFPIYNYLGVRKDSNSAGTKTLITRTINYIFGAKNDKSFIQEVKRVLDFLGLEEELYISYSPRYKHLFFTGEVTSEFIDDFYNNYNNYLSRKTEPWSAGVYRSLKKTNPDIFPQLANLLNELAGMLKNYENSRAKYFEFDIFDERLDVSKYLELLPYLHRLDLISYPGIVLRKPNKLETNSEGYYDIEESSSGEYHFLSSVIGLLANITDNSVVLIDEPEISLHPNWQMKYIDYVGKAVKRYNSAHFIICSHSHFFVSDLKPENSRIISVKREDEVVASSIEYSAYGWSAENVLLNVFDVATTRNYYIAERLSHIFKAASSSKKVDLSQYKQELQDWYVQLSNDDPLHYTIEKLLTQING